MLTPPGLNDSLIAQALGADEEMASPGTGSDIIREPNDVERLLAFAMGAHTRCGEKSLVRLLNDNVIRAILLCEITVGPTRHYSSLAAALSSSSVFCSTMVRIELEEGIHEMDDQADVPCNSRSAIFSRVLLTESFFYHRPS
jgi:hypothetical protein